jgi:hypothetical protein
MPLNDGVALPGGHGAVLAPKSTPLDTSPPTMDPPYRLINGEKCNGWCL